MAYTPNIPEVTSFVKFMTVERNCAERTASEYARDIERFAAYIAPKSPIRAKTKHCRRWISSLMEDGSNKPQSAMRKIAALTAFYKWLIREKVRKSNPMDGIEKPKGARSLPKCMTQDEVERLLHACRKDDPFYSARDRAMMEVLYGSGLRRAEVTDLNLADVDLEKRIVHVTSGKGRKERFVFLGEESADTIREYLAVRPAGGDAMFTTKGGRRISPRQLWVVFRGVVQRSGIKKHVVPHTMRHSYATHMLERGADIMTIKELLGHESVATTQVYTNVSVGHMRETFERTHPRAGRGIADNMTGESERLVSTEKRNDVHSPAHAGRFTGSRY